VIRPARVAAAAITLLAATAACRDDGGRTELIVFAASSLADVFGALEVPFERTVAADPGGVDVVLHLAGSQALRLQVEQGAPADVVATADTLHMQALEAGGHVAPGWRTFATNEVVAVAPAGSPVDTFEGLLQARRVVVGAPETPIGRYTEALLDRAGERLGAGFAQGVRDRVVSREANVRLVLSKVALGEADAAFVYRTDAASGAGARGPGVRVLEPPAGCSPRAALAIAPVRGSARPDLAARWIAWVLGPDGRAALALHGFGPPDTATTP